MNPKSTCVFRKRYRMHNHRVKSIVPSEKLLVYNVKQGWKPLCDFLGCEVPTSAFPHENIKGEIATRMNETTIGRQVNWEVQRVIFVLLSLIVVITAASLVICFCWWNWLSGSLADHNRKTFSKFATLSTRGGGGEYSWEFLVGMCRPFLQTLTPFQTRKCHYSHPFSDLASKKWCHHCLD